MTNRAPNADERAGMDWWNSLSPSQQRAFLEPIALAGGHPSAAACWAAHKSTVERLAANVETCVSDEKARGVLSSGERLAVGLVLGRVDWLREDGWKSLDAVHDYLDVTQQLAVRAVTAKRTAR